MAIGPLITQGLGTFANVSDIVTYGYASGDNNVISDQDAQKIANAVWKETLDGQNQAKQLMRLFAAVLGGKVSGFEDNKPAFRNLLDTKDVIQMVTDSKGNRVQAIILDLNE